IQALDRLDRVLPLSPGRAERHGFEYYRHRDALALCAFNTRRGSTGQDGGPPHLGHTSAEFVAFLSDLVAHQPARWDPAAPSFPTRRCGAPAHAAGCTARQGAGCLQVPTFETRKGSRRLIDLIAREVASEAERSLSQSADLPSGLNVGWGSTRTSPSRRPQ